MKYIINKHHRNTPDRILLADLRKTAKRLGKKHVSFDEYEAEGEYYAGTFCTRFGGWNAALVKAGLKVKKLSWIPNNELMMNLKNVWDTLGRQPVEFDMRSPISLYCSATYAKHFGSWRHALNAFVKFIKKGKYKPAKELKNLPAIKPKKKPAKKINIHVNKSMRFDVLRRDNYKCRLCGASPATDPKVTLHVDHIIPASKGGGSILENLQTLCSDCNIGKAAKSINNEQ